ncbi:MAG: M42 family metallopeptidase [Saprospiraceae bacterium]|nr:M42 family metallopeptidase [Bacteroidia bacterium]MBT8229425.1 M42 family metallopeptidase [Bacteroidia bacterium]NNF21410.1 M42 family metallopeptidase [Saprospiraceae bacterium]
MIDIELLRQTTQVPGAPGFEHRIREFIKKEIEGYVDEISTDAMGNLVALRKGKSDKKMMIAAHMDEISFIVTHIDDNGFIRFHTLGGFDPKTLTAQRVIIHGEEDIIGVMGTKPIHVLTPEEKAKSLKATDFFIDTGYSGEDVKKLISVGDPITRERSFIEMGNTVNSKSIDNRVSVFILIEALKELKDVDLPLDIYAVFTTQEEVGIRGAIAATMGIDPDFAINLDVTLAYDLPGAGTHEQVTQLGKGTAIKVLDGMTICDYRMVRFMKEVAQKQGIDYQVEVLTAGGTDTAGMQRYARGGSIAGGISIPTRYLHQVIEMAHKKDIRDSIDLLKSCLNSIDDFDWSHQ